VTVGHSSAQEYRARHHFPKESIEWENLVLKCQTHLYCSIQTAITRLRHSEQLFSVTVIAHATVGELRESFGPY
jgi:hypothetical protein